MFFTKYYKEKLIELYLQNLMTDSDFAKCEECKCLMFKSSPRYRVIKREEGKPWSCKICGVWTLSECPHTERTEEYFLCSGCEKFKSLEQEVKDLIDMCEDEMSGISEDIESFEDNFEALEEKISNVIESVNKKLKK